MQGEASGALRDGRQQGAAMRCLKRQFIPMAAVLMVFAGTGSGQFSAIPVRTTDKAQTDPAVCGNVIVWSEYYTSDQEVWSYNIATGVTAQITGAPVRPTASDCRHPDVYGDVIVYYNQDTWKVDGHSLSTGSYFDISRREGTCDSCRIGGNYVVYEYTPNVLSSDVDIFAYDLNTGQESVVVDLDGFEMNPDVDGNVVVWADWRNPPRQYDIYGYDLSAKQEFPVWLGTDSPGYPRISGTTVVWQSYEENPGGGSSYNVYSLDLRTGQRQPICVGAQDSQYPVVSGDFIVWQDDRNGDIDLYGYRISTGAEFQITSGNGHQLLPDLDGNVLVWVDYRSGNRDLYMTYIPEPAALFVLTMGGVGLLRARRGQRVRGSF